MNPASPPIPSPPKGGVFLRLLGSRVDGAGFAQALSRIAAFAQTTTPHQIVTANTLMLLAAERDDELRELIESAALVIPESWGLYWASRHLRRPLPRFTPGIDLMTALCAQARDTGRSVFLLGAEPGAAERSAERLVALFPGLRIAGCRHGYFSRGEEAQVLSEIRSARPTYLFVGMSVPAQEKWIARRLAELQTPVVMGVGGSFDVLSGRLRRAPRWMRRLGIEWMFRLAQEPWRWRRIAQLPVFMGKILREGKQG